MAGDENENEVEIAKLNERSENQKDRITKLETNQRWGVLTLLGLMLKAAFDFFSKGQP